MRKTRSRNLTPINCHQCNQPIKGAHAVDPHTGHTWDLPCYAQTHGALIGWRATAYEIRKPFHLDPTHPDGTPLTAHQNHIRTTKGQPAKTTPARRANHHDH